AERAQIAPALGAHRPVFTRAEARLLAGAARPTAAAVTAAFARPDRAVARPVGETGIGEGAALVAPPRADRVIFPRAGSRIRPRSGSGSRSRSRTRFLDDDAGRQDQQTRDRRRETAQNG